MAKPLALTSGEPAGIGPDIALEAWLRRVELKLQPERARKASGAERNAAATRRRCQPARPAALLDLDAARHDPCADHLAKGSSAFRLHRRLTNDATVIDDRREGRRAGRCHHARERDRDDELHQRHPSPCSGQVPRARDHRTGRCSNRGRRYIFVRIGYVPFSHVMFMATS